MPQFHWERRVKWRTTSSSPISGMPAISPRSSAAGISAAGSAPAGTGGSETPMRPGEPCSNTRGSSMASPRVAPMSPVSCEPAPDAAPFSMLGFQPVGLAMSIPSPTARRAR